jgi:selenide,water dikinase
VGFETSDDAAVYMLGDRAVLLTVDFFTPMVDDAYDFGRITAANALSDVYAMGGRPLVALNLLAFPCSMSADVVAGVLKGGADVCASAGVLVAGGHTIDDNEPKFGLAVMGEARPDEVVRNVGANPGDLLVLTKRIGVGIMNTALKAGLESEETLGDVIESMAHLNKSAAEAMTEVGVNAGTDVTGFGLLGHLQEMALGSGVAAYLDVEAVPVWRDALEYARRGVKPGRTLDVIEALDEWVSWGSVEQAWKDVLCDPQTSGGLLMSVSPERVDELLGALARRGEEAQIVGGVLEGQAGQIELR